MIFTHSPINVGVGNNVPRKVSNANQMIYSPEPLTLLFPVVPPIPILLPLPPTLRRSDTGSCAWDTIFESYAQYVSFTNICSTNSAFIFTSTHRTCQVPSQDRYLRPGVTLSHPLYLSYPFCIRHAASRWAAFVAAIGHFSRSRPYLFCDSDARVQYLGLEA